MSAMTDDRSGSIQWPTNDTVTVTPRGLELFARSRGMTLEEFRGRLLHDGGPNRSFCIPAPNHVDASRRMFEAMTVLCRIYGPCVAMEVAELSAKEDADA